MIHPTAKYRRHPRPLGVDNVKNVILKINFKYHG